MLTRRTQSGANRGGKLLRGLVLFTAILFLVVACDSEFKIEPLPDAGKDNAKAAAPSAQADPANETVQPEKDYIYTSIGKRDPFRSIFDEAGGGTDVLTPTTILGPLQNFDVNSFEVAGIVWGISSPTAMVKAPDGKSYIVKTGTLIGRNWGRVIKIKRDSIVVLEQSPLPNGTKVTNLIELKLPVKTINPVQGELDVDKAEQQDGEDMTEIEQRL